MPLETASFINQLDEANPLGSDPIAAGDDHLRLIKATLKASFPNIGGAVDLTEDQINDALLKAGGTMTGPLFLSGDAVDALNPVSKQQLEAQLVAVLATLGSMAAQESNNVSITGGAIAGTTVNGQVVGSNSVGARTVSTSNPTGGSDGDIWYKV